MCRPGRVVHACNPSSRQQGCELEARQPGQHIDTLYQTKQTKNRKERRKEEEKGRKKEGGEGVFTQVQAMGSQAVVLLSASSGHGLLCTHQVLNESYPSSLPHP